MLVIPPPDISRFIHVWRHHTPTLSISLSPSEIARISQVPPRQIASSSALTPIPQKYVALTFDDGPYGTSTNMILDILEREHVPATFFLIGRNVEKYPNEVKRELALGHVIGNHSYTHSNMLSVEATSSLRDDISRAETVISHTTTKVPHFFRAPYSRTSPAMIDEIRREGYILVGWTLDPRDWDNANSSSTLISTILNGIHPGSIIVMHDGHEFVDYSRRNTIQALPVIIQKLRSQGYTFVTVDKILKTDPYKSTSPISSVI